MSPSYKYISTSTENCNSNLKAKHILTQFNDQQPHYIPK